MIGLNGLINNNKNMNKTKCITFDKAAQDALPDHIKAKMKRDRETVRFLKIVSELEGCAPSVGYATDLAKKAKEILSMYQSL